MCYIWEWKLGVEKSHVYTAIDSDGLVVPTLKLDISCIRFKRDNRRAFFLLIVKYNLRRQCC